LKIWIIKYLEIINNNNLGIGNKWGRSREVRKKNIWIKKVINNLGIGNKCAEADKWEKEDMNQRGN